MVISPQAIADFMEEIGIIFGGLGTIGNGLKCLMVGLQIITCWPVGTILGAAMVVVGGATMLMGANDVILGLTGRNLIQEITGISDKAYMWLNIGLNVASALLTIAASIANAKGMLCFVAGTGVLTVGAGGVIVRKAIEDIKVGDRVVTYNEATGMTEIKTVTQTFTSSHTELVKVSHSGGQVITSSLGHPYYTQRGWISAEDLRAGDILQTVNGEAVVVELVQHELLESPQTLYNFEVEGNHNYYMAESVYVGVSEFVLAHNAGCDKPNSPQKLSDNYLKKDLDIDAHKFKAEFVPKKDIAKWDIFVDKTTDTLWLGTKDQKTWINTLINRFM